MIISRRGRRQSSRPQLRRRRWVGLAVAITAGAGFVAAGPTDVASAADAPSVLAIAPVAGPLEGANTILIRVTDAPSVTSVDFGDKPSPAVTPVDSDHIKALAPAHAAGDVDIVVHAGGSSSAPGPADVYRYVPDPPTLHMAHTTIGPSRGYLRDIACGSQGFCVTREFLPYRRTQPNYNLVTFGAGRTPTSTHAVISPPDVLDTNLLACATPDFCVAGKWSFATVWDGHGWSTPSRLVGGGPIYPDVQGLSCAPGTQLCVYIGPHGSVVHTGGGWHIVAYPQGFANPNSVSCPTATRCLAVHPGATAVFDGHRWRNGSKALRLDFRARILCPSAGYCVAMGSARTRTASWRRTASWHDGRWHDQPGAPPHCTVVWACDHGTLACIPPNTCMLAQRNWVMTLAGGAWSSTHTPPGRGAQGFACAPGGLCRATDSRGEAMRFVAGRWTGVDDVVEYQSYLVNVSCATANWCMATEASGQAYLYTDGTWTPQGHVDGREHLSAISCAPDRDCVALDAGAGSEPSGLYGGGRAVRYVDGQWQAPVQIDSGHVLIDVSCPTSSMCVAVDNYGRAITMHDGTWSAPQQVVDVAADPHAALTDVSCPTEGYCVAAGEYTYELLNGTWQRIPDLPYEAAVDCPDANYCVFVDATGIRIRTGGLLVNALRKKNEQPYGFVTCTDRFFCVVQGPFTIQDSTEDSAIYAVAGGALRRVDYDELLPYVYNTSCVEAFCAAVGGFDAYAGPVS